jgi:hypothetical protein
MAGQMVASPSCCVALPPFGTYSVSFWFFRLSALIERLSFFSVFFFWKIILRRNALPTNNVPLSKQRFVLIVVGFPNQLPELLKMIFYNVVQIRINRQFVNAHNVGKPVKRIVVFLPYIDGFTFACRSVRDFKELSAIILFRPLLRIFRLR